MHHLSRYILALLAVFAAIPGRAATTLLPIGQQCFVGTTGLNGMVGLLGTITGGTLYTAGTYGGVSLTGGSGTGATGSIVVSGGAVASVVIQNPGVNYVVGDVLSATAASIGGTGAGFSVPVSSVAVNSSLAGGTVNMFVPNTTNPKPTWKDPGQVTLNAVPIILDANGCAIIYGTGSYRQQVTDSMGNLVFDQLTTDTSSQQAPFWAGVAGGTPNVITVTDTGFNATDGSVVNFTALGTNIGATTINPSAFGNITVLKDTTGGPAGLTGGEIIATNPISVVYRASDNAFHILNPVTASPSGATASLCGASGLKITNGATPNSIISVTATQAVLQTPAGLTINRSNVSLAAINITTGNVTATANGMDGEAPGLSAWLDIFIIDNGAAPAGLVSLAAGNAKAPVMPSGYTYKCYMGSMRVDGSGNLFRTLQLGNRANYTAVAATNTANLPAIASTAANVTFLTSFSTATVIPPTATYIQAVLNGSIGNGTAESVTIVLSPNNLLTFPSATSSVPCGFQASNTGTSTFTSTTMCTLALETPNTLFWGLSLSGSVGGFGQVLAYGWLDAVNAN